MVIGCVRAWQDSLADESVEERTSLGFRVVVDAVAVRQQGEAIGDRDELGSE
ncbi:unannotated protein [freshwater metagenome]|uniref:Unannotated protein n=1 Tax=freshwater metagenome TaxID=449393 RepID=A0A6J7EPM7_9ZZZZ